jgi:hypothetical protein
VLIRPGIQIYGARQSAGSFCHPAIKNDSSAILPRVYLAVSRRISRIYSVERNLKMKTFIVYDLDSQMPVAVGEQVSAETARCCASVAPGIFEVLAEEIDLEKQISCAG